MVARGDLRRSVYEREQGRCFVTGLPLGDVDGDGWDMHHRRPGGKGGTRRRDQDTMPNVVAVLAGVHNFGHPALAGRSIHGNPGWSAGLGLLLSPLSIHPPASRAVRHWRHGWVWLLPEGSYLPVSGPGQANGGAGSPPAPPLIGDAIAPGVTRGSPPSR